jgi:S-DNA-T family DNA segregation ATPase FtsK/SpoIIIE
VASSALSRRASEFVGVALFAAALIWLIALASYSPADPVWFFNTGSDLPPGNFAGRIGAFMGELSFQVLGYAAYLIPLVLAVIGWHYFWCRAVDAAYTKIAGALLLFGCVSSFMSLAFGTFELSGKAFRAGGYAGDRLAALLAEYLNRTGSIILILTLLFAAIVLSTQFSFGRLFSALAQTVRGRLAAIRAAAARRRDEKERKRQREEVLRKHLGKEAKDTKGAKDTKEPVSPSVVLATLKTGAPAAASPDRARDDSREASTDPSRDPPVLRILPAS